MPSEEELMNKEKKKEKHEKSRVDKILELIEKQEGKLEECQSLGDKQRINKKIV